MEPEEASLSVRSGEPFSQELQWLACQSGATVASLSIRSGEPVSQDPVEVSLSVRSYSGEPVSQEPAVASLSVCGNSG